LPNQTLNLIWLVTTTYIDQTIVDSDDSTKQTNKLTFQEKLDRARQRGTAGRGAAKSETPAPPARLPIWPDAVRAMPNSFLRSALFSAIRKGQKARRYINEELLATVDGIEVRYKGEQLDQGDLTTWATLLHAVRNQNLGTQCRLTSYSLLKMIGLTDSGKNRDTLHSRIMRLRANAVEIKQGRYTYIGGFIARAVKDEETQEWVIEIDAKIQSLFAPDQFTQIDWEIRRALDGQQLAQWLHGFYASHAEPFPIRMETLLKLAGSENENPRSAQQKLRKALDAFVAASEAHGQPISYEVRGGDLVYVEKQAQGTQRRHLAKKKAAVTKPRT